MRLLGIRLSAVLIFLFLGWQGASLAKGQAFDLVGPKVDLHVQRNGKTLPISQVANLMGGDRLWIHPDFPDSQAAHYVLIVAFLRGATNPPPVEWFTRVETWTRQVHDEGVFVVVPEEAQQALFFLAPETGGDFSTLRQAVRGRPGAFVRATQDLEQASWDRMRLDAFLAGVKHAAQNHPLELKDRTNEMAHTLGIKVDQQCFDKPSEQQAPCLTQHTDGLVLDDSNAQTLVNQLTNGSVVDLMNQITYTHIAGAGSFSPYVGAVVDVAKILGSIHTAHYQYIPALAIPEKDTERLRLNVPPSFRDPKSVIVVALPPVGPAKSPLLLPTNAALTSCVQKPSLVLKADGAPMVYSSEFYHDLRLHIDAQSGPLDLPVHPDAQLGGVVLDKAPPVLKPAEFTGVLRGKYGFDDWEGPHFKLISAHPLEWKLTADDQTALVVDREDKFHLEGFAGEKQPQPGICIEWIERLDGPNPPETHAEAKAEAATDRHGEPLAEKTETQNAQVHAALKVEPVLSHSEPTLHDETSAKNSHIDDKHKLAWSEGKGDEVEVVISLKRLSESVEAAGPGTVKLAIHQYGLPKPDQVELKTYTEAASVERLTLNAGDASALLKGKRLDEVASIRLEGVIFTPSALNRVQDEDQLSMQTTGATDALMPQKNYKAEVSLRDGRILKVAAAVGPPRPQIHLRNKGVQFTAADVPSIHLSNSDDLPISGRIVFFLDSKTPANYPRSSKIELAATDGSFSSTLTLADGSLILEDAHTVLGSIEPAKLFGASAFGPVHIRVVAGDNTAGDWIPLGSFVRLPTLAALRCPRAASKACLLSGNNLFLLDSISATQDFQNALEVPSDFTGTEMAVPRTTNGTLYLKLRDDASVVHVLTLPIQWITSAQAGTVGQLTPTTPSTTDLSAASEEKPVDEAGGKGPIAVNEPGKSAASVESQLATPPVSPTSEAGAKNESAPEVQKPAENTATPKNDKLATEQKETPRTAVSDKSITVQPATGQKETPAIEAEKPTDSTGK